MIEWLTLIVGTVVAIATVSLAYITWQYVLLTRQTLKATYKPKVIIRLLRGNLHIHDENFGDYEIILCVKNVGPGVARKIEFGDRDNLSFAPYGGESFENVNFLKYGIDLLAPGDERRHNKPIVPNPHGDLNQLTVALTVTYEDSDGTKYSEPFPLNFAESDLPPVQGYSQ
jgi:hypothetical protein